MRKSECLRFVKEARELIIRLGGQPSADLRDYCLLTRYGELRLSVYDHVGSRVSGPGWVAACFENTKQSFADDLQVNTYSGKWNHHYFAPWTVDEALADLEWQLKRVLV